MTLMHSSNGDKEKIAGDPIGNKTLPMQYKSLIGAKYPWPATPAELFKGTKLGPLIVRPGGPSIAMVEEVF